MSAKIEYFFNSFKKRISGWSNSCPYCKNDLSESASVDNKFLITSLVSCSNCRMLVRTPTDDVNESTQFYQDDYTQGYTTDCPTDEVLKQLIETNFIDSERDYSRYLSFFEFLGITKNLKILDFGCSWGYGLYQIMKGGYLQAEGFEVSVPRVRFGIEKLHLPIHSNPQKLTGSYDVIFSSHVLEHLPDFSLINELYDNHLNQGGYFIAITPNGSQDFKEADYQSYHHLWGKVHPVLLSDEFVLRNYKSVLQYLSSWNSMHPVFEANPVKMDKYELVFVLRKPL